MKIKYSTIKMFLFSLLLVCMWVPIFKPQMLEAAQEKGLWTDYAAKSFSYGDGSKDNPYQIDTAEELALLALKCNMQDAKYSDKHYVLTANIDLQGHYWVPIGAIEGNENGVQGFRGVFDGANYCISNMSVQEVGNLFQYGLFGWNMGKIHNVHLKDARIGFESVREGWIAENGMGSWVSVGGIAGYTSAGSSADALISDCVVENIQINVKTTMSAACGGVAGNNNYGSLESCTVTGNISAISGRSIKVGGAIGGNGNESNVSKVSFVGNITSKNDGSLEFEHLKEQGYSYLHYAGGLFGTMGRANRNVKITDSYAIATVKSTADNTNVDAGGFAGAVGLIYGECVFENLYCKSDILVVDKNGTEKVADFVRGENRYMYQADADLLVVKNCVTLTEKQAIVKTYDGFESVNETIYDVEASGVGALFKTLGFKDSIWSLYNGGYPTLKNNVKKPVAAGGWKKTGAGWWYQNADGTYPKDCWKVISDKWYAFDSRGYMREGWFRDNQKWYYLQPNSGYMVGGWQYINNKFYYFGSGGAMATGWQSVNGEWYYFKSTGEMTTGWMKQNNIWYYFKPSGEMTTGWLRQNGKWFYFKDKGEMAIGWVKVGNTWYYMEENGVMATGWINLNGTWYYLYENGAMAADTWIGDYYVNSSGAWVR